MDGFSGVSKDTAVDVLGVLLTLLAQPPLLFDVGGSGEAVSSALERERAARTAVVEELKVQEAVLESGARLTGGRSGPGIARHLAELEDLCRELARQRALLRQPSAIGLVQTDVSDRVRPRACFDDLDRTAADLALEVRQLRSQRRHCAKRGATPPRLAAEVSALRAVVVAQEAARSEAELRLADLRTSVRAFECAQAGRIAFDESATARLPSQATDRVATEVGAAIGLLGQTGVLELAQRPPLPSRQSPLRRSGSIPGARECPSTAMCPRAASPQRPAWRL